MTDALLGFKEVEFDIQPLSGPLDPFGVTVDFYDNLGGVFSTSGVQIGNGSNWFSAIATDGQWITRVVITTEGDVGDVRQVRIGGIGAIPNGVIPEPATWTMLIAGFGLVGSAMRRRRNVLAHIAS